MTQRPTWSDAAPRDAGHGRRGAGRLDHDGVQRLQPAREALAASCASGSWPRPTSSATPARTRSPARCGAGAPACSGSCSARRSRTPSRTRRRSSSCAGWPGAGIALHLVPASGGAGDAALVLDAAVDAFVLFALPDGHPLVDAVLRRRLPVVVQSGPGCQGHPFVAIDERAAAAAAARAPAGARPPRLAVLSLPFSLADRGDRPLRAERAGRTASRAAARRATASPWGARCAINDREHGEAAAGVAARRARAADGPAVHERRAGDRRAAGRRRARASPCPASCRSSAGTTRRRPAAPTRH